MKNPFLSSPEKVWKGSLIVISYFLLAACMQHEESLSPRNQDVISGITTQSEGVSSWMKKTFTAHLKSINELPRGSIVSQGQGQAIFHLSEDGTSLQYKLIVANIENVTQAHIHCGNANQNGSVVAFLFGFVAGGVDVNGILAEGAITASDLRPAPASCPDLDTFEELVERLRNGTAYVNVHTVLHPGGEIRGQVK